MKLKFLKTYATPSASKDRKKRVSQLKCERRKNRRNSTLNIHSAKRTDYNYTFIQRQILQKIGKMCMSQ